MFIYFKIHRIVYHQSDVGLHIADLFIDVNEDVSKFVNQIYPYS